MLSPSKFKDSKYERIKDKLERSVESKNLFVVVKASFVSKASYEGEGEEGFCSFLSCLSPNSEQLSDLIYLFISVISLRNNVIALVSLL